ncbi:MAG: hypothetical protein QOH97_5793 [Actinoplanes sp.]|jgi:hypothetical protein|nr:hypothetical protein [Actinoplanes sp.]
MTFHHHLQQLAIAAIASIAPPAAPDIYAVSFLIDAEDDDPRRPTLTIGYNTETQIRRTLHDTTHRSPDPAEARWNYAFWLQNELVVIGQPQQDPAGAATREQWIRDLGLWYDDPTAAQDWLTTVEPLAQQIETRFNTICCDAALALHTNGTIEKSLGRPVPVLVHELEYYEQIAQRTETANPPGLADEFTAWVRLG